MWILTTFFSCIKNEKIYLYDRGKPFRDFLNVKDAVNSIIKSIFLKNLKFSIYNICYGKSYSILEVFKFVQNIVLIKNKIILTIANLLLLRGRQKIIYIFVLNTRVSINNYLPH